MKKRSQNDNVLLLQGLDASNPLAFMAALGTLRSLTDVWSDPAPKMSWIQHMGAWRPELHFIASPRSRDEVISALNNYLPYRSLRPSPTEVRHRLRAARGQQALNRMQKRWNRQQISKDEKMKNRLLMQGIIESSRRVWLERAHPYLLVEKNTNLKASEYRVHLLDVMHSGSEQRFLHDQFAALGSDLPNDEGIMLDTALRTMSGSGHQHQLEFMANLLEQLTPAALHRTLFERWDYGDPIRNLTLRLDPIDDSRYALQWGNPSNDPTRDRSGAMLGANALAVMGFSLVPTVPVVKGLQTVGFAGTNSRNTFWRWPIWRVPACINTARSLLACSLLQDEPLATGKIHALGISVVYCTQRISVDKFRNFSPACALMS